MRLNPGDLLFNVYDLVCTVGLLSWFSVEDRFVLSRDSDVVFLTSVRSSSGFTVDNVYYVFFCLANQSIITMRFFDDTSIFQYFRVRFPEKNR